MRNKKRQQSNREEQAERKARDSKLARKAETKYEWRLFKDEDTSIFVARDHLGEYGSWYEAHVRFDGCIHFYRQHNSPLEQNKQGELRDYLHICDIEDEIDRLQRLKALAVEQFGENWLQSSLVKKESTLDDE